MECTTFYKFFPNKQLSRSNRSGFAVNYYYSHYYVLLKERETMEKLTIEYLPIEDLTAYERNAKLHPQEQINQIVASIQEFGFNDPIAVWKDNVIIEGHGRLIAAQELGYE